MVPSLCTGEGDALRRGAVREAPSSRLALEMALRLRTLETSAPVPRGTSVTGKGGQAGLSSSLHISGDAPAARSTAPLLGGTPLKSLTWTAVQSPLMDSNRPSQLGVGGQIWTHSPSQRTKRNEGASALHSEGLGTEPSNPRGVLEQLAASLTHPSPLRC